MSGKRSMLGVKINGDYRIINTSRRVANFLSKAPRLIRDPVIRLMVRRRDRKREALQKKWCKP